MSASSPTSTWRHNLLIAAGLSVVLLALFYVLALHAVPVARAQGSLQLEITKTLEGSDVVRVGQYLTFTIRITNTGTITVVRLPLIDEYEPGILRLERTDPPPTAASTGVITWTDLTTDTLFGPLAPGESVSVDVVFRAIAPRPATVNRARIGTALGADGSTGGGGSGQDGGGSIGGEVIVRKEPAGGAAPVSGGPITFTITITNSGAADIVRLPLQDVYSTTYLLFWKATPPPTAVNTTSGELRWDDLLAGLGLTRLRPGESLSVTTVYTALRSVDGVVLNRAAAGGVRDEFGNEVAAPRQTEVPIRILPGPGEATPTPRPRPPEDEDEPTPTPAIATPTIVTATAELTATTAPTPGVTPGAVPAPSRLPTTDGGDRAYRWLLVGLALLLGGMLVLLYRRASVR